MKQIPLWGEWGRCICPTIRVIERYRRQKPVQRLALCEIGEPSRCGDMDTSVFDTVILPARDRPDFRRAMFEKHCWSPVQMDRGKLRQMKYVAFYLGAPTSAISHYAKITSIAVSPDDPGKFLLFFEPPEELPHRVGPNSAAASIRGPRYTLFNLLLEARHIEELF